MVFQDSFKTIPTRSVSRFKKERTHEELQNKLDCDEHIKEIKSRLEEKSAKLKELQAELHRTEKRIRLWRQRVLLNEALVLYLSMAC